MSMIHFKRNFLSSTLKSHKSESVFERCFAAPTSSNDDGNVQFRVSGSIIVKEPANNDIDVKIIAGTMTLTAPCNKYCIYDSAIYFLL